MRLSPQTITVSTESLTLSRDGETEFVFSVFPKDALFNYSVGADSCQVAIVLLNDSIASFSLKEIRKKAGLSDDEINTGEYIAIIAENKSSDISYFQKVCLSINPINGDNEAVLSNPFFVKSYNSGLNVHSISISGNGKDFTPFFNADSTKFVFCLPKDVDTREMAINLRHDGEYFSINGGGEIEGQLVDLSKPISFEINADTGERKSYTLCVYPCDLPAISIITKDNVPILSKETWIEDATMSIWNTDCTIIDNLELMIRCRGNASMRFPKKSYAIKLGKKSALLGMPADKRWDLQSNWRDRTNMRNNIAFNLARQCSGLEWTPRMEYCELFIDGQHLGLYALTEHIKIAKNRVNIDEIKNTDTSEEQITGGYLMEIDSYFDNDLKFRSSIMDLPYMIKEPEGDDCLEIHYSYIIEFIAELEEALYSDSFREKYNSLIDVDSFIDWWIIQELTGNEEPQRPHSCYVYKKRGGLLFAGPVWDFDWPSFIPDQDNWKIKECLYYGRLFEDPAFIDRVKKRWSENKEKFENVCNIVISSEAERIRFSEKRNSEYWPIEDEIAQLYNGDEHLSFEDAVNRMKYALTQRIVWMDLAIASL